MRTLPNGWSLFDSRDRDDAVRTIVALDGKCFPQESLYFDDIKRNRVILLADDVAYLLGQFRRNCTTLEITRLGVSPEKRGEGYAKKMVKYVLDMVEEDGCIDAIRTYTAVDNWPAIKLFATMGFYPHKVWFPDPSKEFIGWYRLFGDAIYPQEEEKEQS